MFLLLPHIFFFFVVCLCVKKEKKYQYLGHKSYRIIMKTYLYSFDPLKPHFHVVKLGFTGVYIICLISAQKQIMGTH